MSTRKSYKLAMGKFKSASYGETVAADWLKSLGIEPTAITRVDDLSKRARPNGLLGGKSGTILKVDTADQAQLLGNRLDPKDKCKTPVDEMITNANRLAGDGMYVLLSADGTSSAVRRLSKIFKLTGMTYDQPDKDATGTVNEIINRTHLAPSVKTALVDYVGEQYDNLLPIVKNIVQLPPSEQAEMTWEDVMIRIGTRPGSVLPWGGNGSMGLDAYIINGDVDGACAYYSRLMDGGSLPIMMAGWLAKKIADTAICVAVIDSLGVDARKAVNLVAPPKNPKAVPYLAKNVNSVWRRVGGNPEAMMKLAYDTMQDLAMIKKTGKKELKDENGNPLRKDDGGVMFEIVAPPLRESLDDKTLLLRMVVRAADAFAGK